MKFENFIVKFNHFLTPKRMNYAWILGGALWIGWIISMIAGKGNTDLAGKIIGNDFSEFYIAGRMILSGQSSQLYSIDLAYKILQSLTGHGTSLSGIAPYLNPPLLALFMAPLAIIPYVWAYILWIILGLFSLFLSLKLLGAKFPLQFGLWSLTWFPIFAAVSFGQTSLFTLLIFSLTYILWLKKHPISAGLIFSLVFFKPQLLIGIGFLWLLEIRNNWKALLGLGIGIFCQIGLSFWILPEASFSFMTMAQDIFPKLLTLEGFPIWHAHSVQAFWLTLLPNVTQIAQILYLICVIIGTYYFIRFLKKHLNDQPLVFAAAIFWLIWSIPYISIYDWTLLLIPAIILWENQIQLRSILIFIFSSIWLITLISSPLTYLQLKILPMAVQISIPALFVILVIIYQSLMERAQQNIQK